MLTETKTYSRPCATTVVAVAQPARAQVWGQYLGRAARFFAILIQFALVVIIIGHWQLESQQLARLMWLAFGGFIIHHLLPLRFRLPFFALLSMVAVVTGVGHLGPNVFTGWVAGRMTTGNFLYHLFPGLTLVGIGLGLIGLCHLPIRFGVRIGLVAVAGAGLAFLRAHSQWFPDVTDMWVILGSLFMFRLMLYLYDLKHRAARLPKRTQVDVPRSISAIIIPSNISVCAAGRLQAFLCARCSRMHARNVSAVPAYLGNFPPDCGPVAHVWF